MIYVLKALDGEVSFTPSSSGKTVEVAVCKTGKIGLKSKRLKANKARVLYKTLVSKGYAIVNDKLAKQLIEGKV
jgi:hypothetical protein